MGKTYAEQTITESYVGLAVEQFLVGLYGESWTPGKIDISSPPSGFYSLGPVVEDSPTIGIKKELYSLKLGIPKMLAYQRVTGIDAEISFKCWNQNPFQVQFQFGNTALQTVTTVTTATTASFYYGGSQMTNYALLGVADLTSGAQVVHYFPKVNSGTDFEEAFRPGELNSVAIKFNAVGYSTIIGSCTELVCGLRFYYGPGGLCTL